jgi:hypothetical protein
MLNHFCQGATQQKVQTNKSDVGCQFLAIRSQDYYTRCKDMNSIQSKGFSTLYLKRMKRKIEFTRVIVIDTESYTYTGRLQLIPTSQESVAAL